MLKRCTTCKRKYPSTAFGPRGGSECADCRKKRADYMRDYNARRYAELRARRLGKPRRVPAALRGWGYI